MRISCKCSYLIAFLGLVSLLNILNQAQTLREFAQGRRGASHQRIAQDLFDKLESPQSEAENNKIERLIVNSKSLAAHSDAPNRIALRDASAKVKDRSRVKQSDWFVTPLGRANAQLFWYGLISNMELD